MMDKFAKFFISLVKELIPDEVHRNKLFSSLRTYQSTHDLQNLLSDLRALLNEPNRLELYEIMRPLVLLQHQIEYSTKVPSSPGVKLRTVRLHHYPGESLGFAVRGGYEHGVGVFVTEVVPGSQADRQGLMVGDEVVRVNGFTIAEAIHDDVLNLIKSRDEITLRVTYIGMLPVKEDLGDPVTWQYVDPPVDDHEEDDREENVQRRRRKQEVKIFIDSTGHASVGCSILSDSGPGANFPGIYVEKVKPGSIADLVGLQPGDQILEVNGTNFRRISWEQAVLALKSSRQLNIVIRQKAVTPSLIDKWTTNLPLSRTGRGTATPPKSASKLPAASGRRDIQTPSSPLASPTEHGHVGSVYDMVNQDDPDSVYSVVNKSKSDQVHSLTNKNSTDPIYNAVIKETSDPLYAVVNKNKTDPVYAVVNKNPSDPVYSVVNKNQSDSVYAVVNKAPANQRSSAEFNQLGQKQSETPKPSKAPSPPGLNTNLYSTLPASPAPSNQSARSSVVNAAVEVHTTATNPSLNGRKEAVTSSLPERQLFSQKSELGGAAALKAERRLLNSTYNTPDLLGPPDEFEWIDHVQGSIYDMFNSSNLDGRSLLCLKYNKQADLGIRVEGGLGSPLGGKILVSVVQEGGLAEKSGKMHVGDQLMMINGQMLLGITAAAAEMAIREAASCAGDKIELIYCESTLVNDESSSTYF